MTARVERICASCGNENPAEARFCFSCGAALEAAAPAVESRKTVTVLFCDLVGSTAMGEQMDPETLRGLLTRSFDHVRAIVESHGGVVEKFIGDAAMAVFGIPRVHEDDALRAVRAAAEIREALGSADAPGGGSVAWRTGIATGEVVAGDATAGQRLVTGDAVNVAARLQQSAQPGEILIAAETQQLVRDAVRVESLGEVTVKGRQAPIETFRLLEVDRSAAGHERRLDSPMVGRERPRRLLYEAFAEARDERVCHLFTILGSAGVGKSRLVNEFIGATGEQVKVLRGRCLSYGEGITYWPIGEIVREALDSGSGSTDPAEDLARIRAILGAHDSADRIADVIGQAIGMTPGDASTDEIPWAVRSFLEALAEERPLAVVFDDLQWGEPPVLDLVEHVADWSRDAAILLIVMARHELLDNRPAWGGGKRSATIISLEPLNAEETAELIENFLGRSELPRTVFDRIRVAAEGNPLFVEELLEMLIDDGALTRLDDSWIARQDLSAIAVPPTIQALLAARLDGLRGTERAILERGAVEGTLFHRDAVTALAPEALRETVGPSLLTLTRREFVAPDRAELAGREAFRFRHQLIRDAAYQAISKQSRAELHERFADWLEQALGGRIEEYRPILGYHLDQAARYRRELDPADPALPDIEQRAVEQLGAAAVSALERADSVAAINLLQRVLALVRDEEAAMPWRLIAGEAFSRSGNAFAANDFILETVATARRLGDERSAAVAEAVRLHVRTSLGESLPDVAIDAERLQRELRAMGDEAGYARVTLELAKDRFWEGQAGGAILLASEARDAPNAPARVRNEAASWILGFRYWGPTPVVEALALAEASLSDPRTPPLIEVRAARMQGALLAMLGRFDESERAFEAAVRRHEELGDLTLLASAKGHFVGPSMLLAGRYEEAVALCSESYRELVESGNHGFANVAAAAAAQALVALGRDEEAEAWAGKALAIGGEEDPASAGPALGVLARVQARRGEIETALDTANRAIVQLAQSDHLDTRAGTHADRAEVYGLVGRAEDAAAEMAVALELYERKGNLVSAGNARRRMEEWGAGRPD